MYVVVMPNLDTLAFFTRNSTSMSDSLDVLVGKEACPVCGTISQKGISRCPECGTFHSGIHLEVIKLEEEKAKSEKEAEEKAKKNYRHECGFCRKVESTNYICDRKNCPYKGRFDNHPKGICKSCRDSGKSEKHYVFVTTKKGWIRNTGYYKFAGYMCFRCTTIKDMGGDV